jgi:hypothetical protein
MSLVAFQLNEASQLKLENARLALLLGASHKNIGCSHSVWDQPETLRGVGLVFFSFDC